VLIGAICNIILDPIFIFLFDMGVRGAALATVISQAISCIWVVLFLSGKNSILRLTRASLKPDMRLALPCIALGLAPFIMQSSESVISICFNSSLQTYGGDRAVGAMTVLSSVMQIAMLPLQGLAQGAMPIISYNYGAKNKDRVKGIFKLLLICSLGYSMLLWLAIMIFPEAFAAIFSPDKSFIDYTASVLPIYCGVLGIFGIQIACQMTFVSLGKALSSMIVAIVRKFVLLLPLIYIVPTFFDEGVKAIGVYTAEPIADFIAVTFTAVLFVFQFKKALAEMDGETVLK
jgi:putative MATE family efflux protein